MSDGTPPRTTRSGGSFGFQRSSLRPPNRPTASIGITSSSRRDPRSRRYSYMKNKQIKALAQLHGYWVYQRFLKHSRAWSPERRSAYVLDRLKTTLTRAYQNVPFY